MKLSPEGYKVLHEREGLRLEAYLDTRGILTIGLGHTTAAGPPAVYEGMEITEARAEEIFRQDAERFRREVDHATAHLDLEQHEHDALCSFLYNIGSPNFLGSTVLKRLQAGDKKGAAEALLWWDKPSEIIPRRRGEYEQFLGRGYKARVTNG